MKRLLRIRNEDGTNNPVALGIWAVMMVVILGVMGFVVWRIQDSKVTETTVDNLGEYASGMGSTAKQALYRNLYFTIENNLGHDEKPPRHGAKIREGTYEEEFNETYKVYSGSFVVDLDKLDQSYRVSMSWPKNPDDPNFVNYNPLVACPTKSQVIYPDFQCKDLEAVAFEVNSPAYYLPYTAYAESGEAAFRIWQSGGSEWIMVSYQACGNENLAKEYKRQADDWLKETTIDLKKYKLQYVDTCDGDF